MTKCYRNALGTNTALQNCSAACSPHGTTCTRGCRNAAALPQYVKAFARKGQALQGLGRHREAAATFEAGLEVLAWSSQSYMAIQSLPILTRRV